MTTFKDQKIIVDCSNGIGGLQLPFLRDKVKIPEFHLINTEDKEFLNL